MHKLLGQLTLAMHLCSARSCSEVGSSSIVTVPSLNDPLGKGGPTINLQVLPRDRWTPSIPPVLQVFESLRKQCNVTVSDKQVKFHEKIKLEHGLAVVITKKLP